MRLELQQAWEQIGPHPAIAAHAGPAVTGLDYSCNIYFSEKYLIMKKYSLAAIVIMGITIFSSCQDTAESWYRRAQGELKVNAYKRAVLDLNDAIAIDSNYADAYFLRGKIKVTLGENDDACKDAKKAADLGNKEAALVYQQYCRGVTADELKSKVKTEDSLALLYPNRPEPFYNISNVYFDAKQYQKAIEYCDRAISIDPKYAPAYYNKGACLINLGDKVGGCEFINKAAEMGYDMALQMKPKCEAILKGK